MVDGKLERAKECLREAEEILAYLGYYDLVEKLDEIYSEIC